MSRYVIDDIRELAASRNVWPYRNWVRTEAKCKHCGALGLNRPELYGLSDDTWLSEVDCGCKFDDKMSRLCG